MNLLSSNGSCTKSRVSRFTIMKAILTLVSLGHPFKDAKALLWVHISSTFLWVIWKEHNRRDFMDKEVNFTVFFNLVICYDISWCKLSNIFASYSYASLTSNWKVLL